MRPLETSMKRAELHAHTHLGAGAGPAVWDAGDGAVHGEVHSGRRVIYACSSSASQRNKRALLLVWALIARRRSTETK